MLEKGLSCTVKVTVTEQNTALSAGSGDLKVFATPWMLAAMENAAMRAVADSLPEGSTTVGSEISSSHIKPSGIGAEITATAVLTEADGRKLTFSVQASDADGLIGEGLHTRYIVDRERFLSKLLKK